MRDKDALNLTKAKSVIYRLLKIRFRSEQEIRDRLKLKKFSAGIINKTVSYFKDLDLINDYLFTQMWIKSRLRRPFGTVRIRFELLKKGIDKDIIDGELNRVEQDIPEEEIVRELALNKADKYGDIDPKVKKQRLFGYLNRRGFKTSTIYKVINSI